MAILLLAQHCGPHPAMDNSINPAKTCERWAGMALCKPQVPVAIAYSKEVSKNGLGHLFKELLLPDRLFLSKSCQAMGETLF
jgi:hypothetical protein